MQPTTEIWRDITNYKGYYQVSSYGRVRSLDRYVNCVDGTKQHVRLHKGRILKPNLCQSGYPHVVFSVDQKKKTHKVHRLVAEAFIPNPNNYPCVNHKDHNKANAHVTNLEWCTYLYNVQYSDELLNNHYRRKSGLTRAIPINQYDRDGNLIASYMGAGTIERLFGISVSNTKRRCRSDKIARDGYYWRYAPTVEVTHANF